MTSMPASSSSARISDVALLEKARAEAVRLFEEDPELAAAEHQPLKEEMVRVWQGRGEWS